MGYKNGKASKTDSGFIKDRKSYVKPQLKKYKSVKKIMTTTALGIAEI